jgi:diacylglycerol kinase family enzyme
LSGINAPHKVDLLACDWKRTNNSMKVSVVVNRAAGGIRGDSDAHLLQVMRSAGLDSVDIADFDRVSATQQLCRLAAQSPDFLVVWGGDGTHRTALNSVGRQPSNLVLLPGGTRNLLAKSLHGAETWDRILPAVLAAPRQHVLPAGQIDSERFFCAMLAGAPAVFAGARESLRDGDLGAALNEVGTALEAAQDMRLIVRAGDSAGVEIARLPPTSIIGALVGFLARNSRMEAIALNNPSLLSALDVIWSSFHSGFHHLQRVSVIPADTLIIENEGGSDIPTILDGESLGVGAGFQVRFVERGGYCLTAS